MSLLYFTPIVLPHPPSTSTLLLLFDLVRWRRLAAWLCDRPGLYDCRLPSARKVEYHQSFGGRPINLPDVTQHSTIDANTDKVSGLLVDLSYWYTY